jgi:ParB-like chromosome segregation protein Spo0J
LQGGEAEIMLKTYNLSDIRIGERFRKDLGNLDSLAASIRDRGLFHLPLVTTNGELVCGRLRILAMQKLGWVSSDVWEIEIDPDNMLLAERDENEERKQFTTSERVAIGRAIEALVSNGQGKHISNHEPVARGPQVDESKSKKARDIAAKGAGFESAGSYRRASKVIDNGHPALVEAVDKGEIKVSTAAVLSTLPKEIQAALVADSPKAAKAKAKEIQAAQATEPDPEMKAEKAAATWAKIFNDYYMLATSLKRRGGVETLAAKWPAAEIERIAGICDDASEAFTEYGNSFRSLLK